MFTRYCHPNFSIFYICIFKKKSSLDALRTTPRIPTPRCVITFSHPHNRMILTGYIYIFLLLFSGPRREMTHFHRSALFVCLSERTFVGKPALGADTSRCSSEAAENSATVCLLPAGRMFAALLYACVVSGCFPVNWAMCEKGRHLFTSGDFIHGQGMYCYYLHTSSLIYKKKQQRHKKNIQIIHFSSPVCYCNKKYTYVCYVSVHVLLARPS